ncbi:hypothetical protein FS749_002869 [Ceratobasidium sp. UAMH 11750]|nr:hypothetical protein FS749_002869 [Ceratobasidium sp. UAMH 11750]
MPSNSQIEFILGGVQNRMAERQAAINTGNIQAEWQADQAITQGLYYAGNACPANHPGARQGFHNAANRYSNSRSRGERDNLVYKIAKSVLIKKAILAILLGAGTLTIAELAAPATMFSVDGTEFYGHAIDNGDGTHQFLYDTNGNGWDDTQVTVSNATGQAISAPDHLGLVDTVKNVFELLF